MMITKIVVRFIFVVSCVSICAAAMFVDQDDPDDIRLSIKQLGKMDRITQRRYVMDMATAFLCRMPPKDRNLDLHVDYYCEVHTNKKATETMQSGDGIYPVGSIIIKSKFAGENAEKPELYTIMRKMEKGYDEKHGDWEYAVVNGMGNRILAQGKIESCISCHKNYGSTDYVTRAYFESE